MYRAECEYVIWWNKSHLMLTFAGGLMVPEIFVSELFWKSLQVLHSKTSLGRRNRSRQAMKFIAVPDAIYPPKNINWHNEGYDMEIIKKK